MTKTVYRRVGVFYATERNVKEDGEWFRDSKASSVPLNQQINAFAEEHGVEVIFVSPPNVKMVENTEDAKTYFVGVSAIYIPRELIADAHTQLRKEQEEGRPQEGPFPPTLTKEAVQEILSKAQALQVEGGES